MCIILGGSIKNNNKKIENRVKTSKTQNEMKSQGDLKCRKCRNRGGEREGEMRGPCKHITGVRARGKRRTIVCVRACVCL